MANQVPFDPKVLHLAASPSDKSYVIGGKCPACGEVMFPRRENCLKCSHPGMQEIPLSTEGEVYCSTAVYYAPPLYKGPMPYVIGEVLTREGATVPTPFTGCEQNKPLPIGTRVQMVVESVGQDDKGNQQMVHKFKPVA